MVKQENIEIIGIPDMVKQENIEIIGIPDMVKQENIEIIGIPDTVKQENLEETFITILKNININVTSYIVACHQLRKKKNVTLANVKNAIECMQNKKLLRIQVTDYNFFY